LDFLRLDCINSSRKELTKLDLMAMQRTKSFRAASEVSTEDWLNSGNVETWVGRKSEVKITYSVK
jgi:hypothetical protein